MFLAIVGSRGFEPLSVVRSFVSLLPPDTIVVSGGAYGVDTAAERAAGEFVLARLVFPAQWKLKGMKAGIARNYLIVQASDVVIAFWDGKSKGTKSSMDLAIKLRRPLHVFTPTSDLSLEALSLVRDTMIRVVGET